MSSMKQVPPHFWSKTTFPAIPTGIQLAKVRSGSFRCSNMATQGPSLGAINRAKHASGHAAASLLNPVHGVRGARAAQGKEVKDHAKDNIRKMRMRQRANRSAKEEAENTPESPRFVLKKFQNVESKVKKLESKPPADGPKKEFLKKSKPSTQEAPKIERFVRKPIVQPKPSVPKASEAVKISRAERKDFLIANAKAVIGGAGSGRPASATRPSSATEQHKAGEVPQYLLERKAKWAAADEERRRKAGAIHVFQFTTSYLTPVLQLIPDVRQG